MLLKDFERSQILHSNFLQYHIAETSIQKMDYKYAYPYYKCSHCTTHAPLQLYCCLNEIRDWQKKAVGFGFSEIVEVNKRMVV